MSYVCMYHEIRCPHANYQRLLAMVYVNLTYDSFQNVSFPRLEPPTLEI